MITPDGGTLAGDIEALVVDIARMHVERLRAVVADLPHSDLVTAIADAERYLAGAPPAPAPATTTPEEPTPTPTPERPTVTPTPEVPCEPETCLPPTGTNLTLSLIGFGSVAVGSLLLAWALLRDRLTIAQYLRGRR